MYRKCSLTEDRRKADEVEADRKKGRQEERRAGRKADRKNGRLEEWQAGRRANRKEGK